MNGVAPDIFVELTTMHRMARKIIENEEVTESRVIRRAHMVLGSLSCTSAAAEAGQL
jgi:hypothetical protein